MASVLNPDSGQLHILGAIDTTSALNIADTSNVDINAPVLGDGAANIAGGAFIGEDLYVHGNIVANGDIITLGNTGATITIDDTLTLTPISTVPATPVSGMMAVSDGIGWDPATDGQEHLNIYLNGAWIQVA